MINHPGGPPDAPAHGRSVFDMFRNLANESAILVRQEITLARAELTQNVRDLVKHTGQIAIGGGIAFVGALVFVVFLIVGLGTLIGGIYWLSTLLVALLLLVGGGAMTFFGARSLGQKSLVPEETMDSLSLTGRWAGEEAQNFRSAVLRRGNGGLSAGEMRLISADGTMRAGERSDYGGPAPGEEGSPDRQRSRSSAGDGAPGGGGSEGSGDAPGGAARPGGSERLPLSKPLWKRVLHEFQDDDVPGQGAKVAFFMFTSLPPALLVLFGLAGIFGGEELAGYLTSRMEGALPGSADDPDSAAGFLSGFVEQVAQENAPGPLSIGLVLGIWASSAVFVALTEALNLAYDVGDDRSWFKRRALAIAVMVGFLLLFLGGSLALITGPFVADWFGLGAVGSLVWSIVQWPLAFGLVVGAFFLAYYLLPNRVPRPPVGILVKSSAIAAGLWLLATLGFRQYIANFGSYSETYGFVGAILVLLLWMWITAIVILTGGEISSEMEREA
jgi:membrane protein